MAAAILTAVRLRELLHYDPESGVFTWRVARGPIKAGNVAGALQRIGYRVIRLDLELHYAHRLAWLYITDGWPAAEVDHIDGDKGNNRWSNLRDVAHKANCANQHVAQGSAGLLGAAWNKRSKNWRAIVTRDDKQIHIGTFPTPGAAHVAYLQARQVLDAEA